MAVKVVLGREVSELLTMLNETHTRSSGEAFLAQLVSEVVRTGNLT